MYPTNDLYNCFNKNIKNFGFEDIITSVRMGSVKAAKKFLEDGIKADFIFIDGDHSYESVKNDIKNWKNILKKDGILCGHDVQWTSVSKALVDSGIYFSSEVNFWTRTGDIEKNDMEIIEKMEITNKNIDVTVVISTKDRYFDTLPLCLSSIINQTLKPKKFILFDDGEQKDLREEHLYQNIFSHLDTNGIEWEVAFGSREGQVKNHQKSIEMAKTDWIWRIDDDEIAEPNVLEMLVSNISDSVGAVAGLVIDPKNVSFYSESKNLHNKIEDAIDSANVQWYKHKSMKIINVEHLYSSFIFRKEAASHGYCLELSPVGHREETIFTYEMKRQGWDLLVDPRAITWHYRSSQGGIRSYDDSQLWEHDDEIFRHKLDIWNKNIDKKKLIILDSGLGDHTAFAMVLPEILKKYPNLILGVCYPEVFEKFDIELISISEAKLICNKENDELNNVYQWMWNRKWNRNMVEAYREMFLK